MGICPVPPQVLGPYARAMGLCLEPPQDLLPSPPPACITKLHTSTLAHCPEPPQDIPSNMAPTSSNPAPTCGIRQAVWALPNPDRISHTLANPNRPCRPGHTHTPPDPTPTRDPHHESQNDTTDPRHDHQNGHTTCMIILTRANKNCITFGPAYSSDNAGDGPSHAQQENDPSVAHTQTTVPPPDTTTPATTSAAHVPHHKPLHRRSARLESARREKRNNPFNPRNVTTAPVTTKGHPLPPNRRPLYRPPLPLTLSPRRGNRTLPDKLGQKIPHTLDNTQPLEATAPPPLSTLRSNKPSSMPSD